MTVHFVLGRLAAALLSVTVVAGAWAQAPAPAAAIESGAPGDRSSASLTGQDTRAARATLETARSELEQAEATLRRTGLTSDDLQDLRTRLDPIAESLRDQIATLGPKLDAARARLEQLGPKPKEDSPEGADVARDRAEREAAVSDLDEVMRLAKALQLQAEQLTSQISDRRRAVFTSALFQRSFGLADPAMWLTVASSFPRDLRALQLLGADALSRLLLRASPFVLTLLGLAVGIGAALHISRRHLAPRIVHRDHRASGVSGFRKLLTACGMLVVETLPAAAGSFLIYQAALLLDVMPGRLVPVAGALLGGLAFLAFVQGLIEALFAPDRPAWRLVETSDPVAGAIKASASAFSVVVVAGRIADSVNQSIAAGLALSVASKAVFATVAAAALAYLLHRLADRPEDPDAECLGPYVAPGPSVSGPIRLLGWCLVGIVVAAALGGYVALASFLVDQIVWIGCVAGLLYLALAACERFLGGTLKEGGRVATSLQANLGLRRRSLIQLGVLLSGIGRVILVIAAGLLALAPWGLESADLAANLRAAFFGFKVGDVTVSLSTTVTAIGLFLGLVAVARIVQRWLADTFLPTTELDAGLRNSIAVAAGYLGFFGASAAAFGFLGLSLEKIALVAGALSVGIGFGLQSIVNNFVSGLILLWERPIRVGDLVVVGADGEGFVRKISVRATEIETFDRSTVIVPNSSLISGTVKNRMRSDITGRVVLPVNVLRNQDPARAAELLIAEATAHPDVIAAPPPRVVFKKIGDTWLEFELVCYVDDVTKQQRVQTELNFAIFRKLVDLGILPPLGPGAMNVGGLEPVQAALQQIAAAIAAHVAEPRPAAVEGAASDPPKAAPAAAEAASETTEAPRLVRRRASRP